MTTTHDRRIVPLKIKAVGTDQGLGDRQFTGYASVFGNVDSYGDVVQPGAFAESLAAWKASGDPIPVLFGHDLTNPLHNVGAVIDAVEDDHGLLVTCQLDSGDPVSDKIYALAKGRRLTRMSFAYDVIDAEPGTVDGQDVSLLKALKLYEVSLVPIPANPAAEVLTVKAAATAAAPPRVKEGRTISADTMAQLQEIADGLDEIADQLAALMGLRDPDQDTPEPDDGTAAGDTAAGKAGEQTTPEEGVATVQAREAGTDAAEAPDGSKAADGPARPSDEDLALQLALAALRS